VLEQLADGCRLMGLPQAWCARVATFIPRLTDGASRDTIDSIFKSAYLKETLKTIPMKFTRPSALLTYKTEAYMKEHYTLRLNVMTGTPEYRMNAVGYGFQPLDQAARNTMAINALKAGVDSWDKDLSRYIDSNLIPRYNPMDDYLHHLPRWDGKHDYVGNLARRVKTGNPHWEEDFHKWMLSMVAQWLGKDRQYGNAIVPLLIGPQGSGKTTFCRRLLPEYLQMYFNDRLSMKSENDIFIAMSSYALINIDEFDAMSKSQQPILKYLLSKHDVKFRPPYGKVMEERQRFASFIATTNNIRPLVDPTGSRRFICVYADEIDNSGIINYNQLFAQLYQELDEGRRYWFEDDDNQRIMEQNKDFQQVLDYERMVEQTYLSPEATPDDAKPVLVKDIMNRLAGKFPTFTIRKGTDMELGRRLSAMGYKYHKLNSGAAYRMVEMAP
jgi:GTPase SAR1 family protein